MTNYDPAFSEAPRQVPADYGVSSSRTGTDQPVTSGPAPDPGNVEDIQILVEPLDPDDDVHERLKSISLVNTEQPDKLEQTPGQAADADR